MVLSKLRNFNSIFLFLNFIYILKYCVLGGRKDDNFDGQYLEPFFQFIHA